MRYLLLTGGRWLSRLVPGRGCAMAMFCCEAGEPTNELGGTRS